MNPGRYVGVASGQAHDEDEFEEQLTNLNNELEALNARALELQQAISTNVVEILGT